MTTNMNQEIEKKNTKNYKNQTSTKVLGELVPRA